MNYTMTYLFSIIQDLNIFLLFFFLKTIVFVSIIHIVINAFAFIFILIFDELIIIIEFVIIIVSYSNLLFITSVVAVYLTFLIEIVHDYMNLLV
jgi:hypothetical protein